MKRERTPRARRRLPTRSKTSSRLEALTPTTKCRHIRKVGFLREVDALSEALRVASKEGYGRHYLCPHLRLDAGQEPHWHVTHQPTIRTYLERVAPTTHNDTRQEEDQP